MMRRLVVVVALFCLVHAGAVRTQDRAAGDRPGGGPVIAVGGGGTTDGIVRRVIALAGGTAAVVVVLPQSSAEKDAGDEAVKMWREAGAKEARKIDFRNVAAARAAIEAATLIWITGGDQTRFMKAIVGTGLDDVIRARQAAGVAVGGTSAGAAVLSKVMITGEADLESLGSGKTQTMAGLGVWPEVIVDQHFLRRQRHNRLFSLVLDTPALVGIGIDEATAAIREGDTVSVLGRSAVMVVDARKADVAKTTPGQPVAARGVTVTILRDGMSASLR